MLFDTIAPPESKFLYTPPRFVEPRGWFEKLAIGLSGYKNDGTKSTFGKISGWIPGMALEQNQIFKGIAKRSGATDAQENAALARERDFGKLETIAGVGLGVAGAATGNLGLIGSGIKLGTTGLGQFLSTPQSALNEQTATDRGTKYFF